MGLEGHHHVIMASLGDPDMTDKLVIFDTTLRDGEQSPGASMTLEEKLRIAKSLERMRVDVIEAGFAIASPGDFESVKAVASLIKDSTVCSLARAKKEDIARAGEALEPAARKRIHTFIATSPIHMKYKLQQTPEEVLRDAVAAVRYARQFTDDVEFSCEDASRTEMEFMVRVVEAVIDAGATTVNLPDTVGYAVPHEYGAMIRHLRERVPNSDKAIFSVHCHNDLGLAVANSLAAVLGGARQVECTINGLGERAGNASLEEIVMSVRTRADEYPLETGIETQHIVPTSRLVSSITGFPVQPNKAIVGANAFAHEAGIHQDGILKNRETYEIMRAQDVGWEANKLVLGKHSGRAAFKARLDDLGVSFADDGAFKSAFARFKELADKKHEIFDEDLQAIVGEISGEKQLEKYTFESIDALSKTGQRPRAELVIQVDGETQCTSSEGDGLVDAAFKAIEKLANSEAELKLYLVNGVTQGTDSLGEVTVRLQKEGRIVNGNGAHTDIIVASAKAYLNALNILESGQPAHPQLEGI